MRRESTGCRDRQAAEKVLADKLTDVEKVRAGVMSRGEMAAASLRHTFAALPARSGASPGVAQKLMRHSDIRLTMNTYTHLDLADTASAAAALPVF